MLKQAIVLLLVLQVSLQTCSTDIPLYAKFQTFITANNDVPQAIRDKVTAFGTATSHAANASSDYGICSSLINGTNTCCTNDFVHYATILVNNQVGKQTKKRPPIYKALQNFEKADADQKCGVLTQSNLDAVVKSVQAAIDPLLLQNSTRRVLGGSSSGSKTDNPIQGGAGAKKADGTCQAPPSLKCADGSNVTINSTTCIFPKCADASCPLDTFLCANGTYVNRTGDNCDFQCGEPDATQKANNTLEEGPLKFFRAKVLQCQVQTILAQRRFTAGQVCALCVDPANASLYFDTTDASNTKLIVSTTAMDSYTKIIADGLACISAVQSALITFVQDQIANNTALTSSCNNTLDRFLKAANKSDNKPCAGGNCSDYCKGNAKVFGDGCSGDLDGSGKDMNLTRILSMEEDMGIHSRILSTGDVSSSSTGFNAYLVDGSSESTITAGGVGYDDTTGSSSSQILKSIFAVLVILATVFVF